MISERKLKEWRKEALAATQHAEVTKAMFADTSPTLVGEYLNDQEKILKMTQTLLDQHLLQKKGKD